MKNFPLAFFLSSALILLLGGCKNASVDPNPIEIRELTVAETKLVQANSKFWLKLFKEIDKDEKNKNVFISPLSVSMALGMTLNGANGATYDSMRATLDFSNLSRDEINSAYRSLIDLLVSIDPKVQMKIANSIWHRNDFTVEPDFINVNKNYFDASVSGLDFRSPTAVETINKWVNDKTQGLISKIIERIPNLTVMYLINAIYFKGNWTYQFDARNTRDELFTLPNQSRVSTKMMMMQEREHSYFANERLQAIDLPYGGGVYSMTIILPRAGTDLSMFLASFSTTEWESLVNSFSQTKAMLLLPKFKLEYSTGLKNALERMGMRIAFIPDVADFTRINKNGGLFISEAKHKTFVEVDEEGTRAAAVTSIGIGIVSAPPEMRVDRPFIFVIREKKSGAILFAGKIVDPR